MEKFVIQKNPKPITSINRTIRIKKETFDKLMDLSIKYDISLNKILNQCLNYALENLQED